MLASMADGRTVKAKQVYASSVRLGKFTVEHVECAVMPADFPNAEPLLGLSFLKNFTFKIDNAGGKLVMSKIEQPEKGGSRSGRSESAKKAGENQTVQEPVAAKGNTAQQLAQWLKPAGEQPQAPVTLQSPSGQPVRFLASKPESTESLVKRFGQPDEIVKIPVKAMDHGEAKPLTWKLWTWGTVRILVNDSGTARYYAVSQK